MCVGMSWVVGALRNTVHQAPTPSVLDSKHPAWRSVVPKVRPSSVVRRPSSVVRRPSSSVSLSDQLVAKERRERAQAALREFIHDVEDAARAERVLALREAREHGMPPGSLPSFIFFDDVMEKIQSGDGDASARWVLKGWASS